MKSTQLVTNTMKKSGLTAMLLMALLLALGVLAPSAQASRALSDVLENYEGYDWNYITNRAGWQAKNDGPLYPSAPPTVPQFETFEGPFTATSANTKIAIFSDDGCDVYINGVKVHSKLSHGQGLPDLAQSLLKIAYTFQSGVSYQIKVVYSNVAFMGNTDIDGASLFAYSETGVKELQYRLNAQSPFATVPSPLVVPLGQSVEFKAMPDPVNATVWPSGKPSWSGSSGGSGSGVTKTVVFNTTSTSATDYKTVSVESGNTISANVLVMKVDKLQYRLAQNGVGQGAFADAPTTLFVPLNQQVEFKAIANPNGLSWPSDATNKPEWSSVGSGVSGATGKANSKIISFNTASTFSTDYKTVSAIYGNSVAANVIVDARPPIITLLATAFPMTASFSDSLSGIDPASVKVVFNGTDVTNRATIAADGSGMTLLHTAVSDLSNNGLSLEKLRVEVKDKSGQLAVAAVDPIRFVSQGDGEEENKVTLTYRLWKAGAARVKIFEYKGSSARTLIRTMNVATQQPGERSTIWDGKKDNGEYVQGGMSYDCHVFWIDEQGQEQIVAKIDPDDWDLPLGTTEANQSFAATEQGPGRRTIFVPTGGTLTVKLTGDEKFGLRVYKLTHNAGVAQTQALPNDATKVTKTSGPNWEQWEIEVRNGTTITPGEFRVYVDKTTSAANGNIAPYGTGTGSFTLSNTFVQKGQAAKVPWAGHWWPQLYNNSTDYPNLYAIGGTAQKYDRYVGTGPVTVREAFAEKDYGADFNNNGNLDDAIDLNGNGTATDTVMVPGFQQHERVEKGVLQNPVKEADFERTTGIDRNGDPVLSAGVARSINDDNGDGVINAADDTVDEYDSGWWGHCHAWAAASIWENEPRSARTKNGIAFDIGDQKGLLTELNYDHNSNPLDAIPDQVNWLTGSRYAGPGTGGAAGDILDPSPFQFHSKVLENEVRGSGHAVAVDTNPGEQVWTYPLWKYEATMTQRGGDKYQVDVQCKLYYLQFAKASYLMGEDKNDNGVLDTGEDINGNGLLDGPRDDPKANDPVDVGYWLKYDATLKAVDGQWDAGTAGNNNPDFAWRPIGRGTPNSPIVSVNVDAIIAP